MKIAFAVLMLAFLAVPSASADMQSVNFKTESEQIAAGGIYSLSGTNFKVYESAIDFSSKENLSSQNFKLDARIGTAGRDYVAVIQSINPADYARYYTDQSASYTVSAVSPDGQALTYRAKQDGTVKAGPQNKKVLTWALGIPARGRHLLSIEVIEPDGTVAKNQSMYVMRRPVK